MDQICTGNPEQLWAYDEPTPEGNRHVVMSEKQIFRAYYPYWRKMMRKVGKRGSMYNCIDDWIIVNWAYLDEWNNNGP